MRYLKVVVLVLVVVLFYGCQFVDEPIAMMHMQGMNGPSNNTAAVDDAVRAMEHRFGGNETQAENAVENALVMSQKFQDLSIEADNLRRVNGILKNENDDLTRQVADLQAQLETTRKELSEANEFLQQMHAELGKWKSDVLGYREEMRRAQVAELEALRKILKILGAELVEPLEEAKVAKEG